MAGDWIKMRNNLWDDPRVSSLCDLTGVKEAAVIGGLYWLWATADEHTENGFMPGLSPAGIDRKTGIKDLGVGLVTVGWIEEAKDGITILRFDEHNGSSAKRRGADAQRKGNVRKVSASDADKRRTLSGQVAGNLGTREEKNREEYSVPDGTGGEPPTERDLIFAKGVPLLTAAGVSDKNSRSMLAMLCKQHHEGPVLAALEQMAHDRPIEPVSWLQSLLKTKPPAETNHQRATRERMAQWVPEIAARAPGTPPANPTEFFETEARDVTALTLGR